jgi:hypothetical protein
VIDQQVSFENIRTRFNIVYDKVEFISETTVNGSFYLSIGGGSPLRFSDADEFCKFLRNYRIPETIIQYFLGIKQPQERTESYIVKITSKSTGRTMKCRIELQHHPETYKYKGFYLVALYGYGETTMGKAFWTREDAQFHIDFEYPDKQGPTLL